MTGRARQKGGLGQEAKTGQDKYGARKAELNYKIVKK